MSETVIDWKDAATHREPNWPLGWYAPGGYMGKCTRCQQQFVGMDKRAMHCLPCAIDAVKEAYDAAVVRVAELESENETLRSAIRVVTTPQEPVDGRE